MWLETADHVSEEFMQNGIFFTGDIFVKKTTNTISDKYIFFILIYMCFMSHFQCQTNQTGGKPQNSPLVTVKSSFHVSSTGRKLFSASTTDLKTTCHSHQW